MIRKIFKWIALTVGALVLIVAILLLVLTVAEYRPMDTETLPVNAHASAVPRAGDSLSVVSWNIGYAALGDNADFFMDGGTMVQTADQARVQQNLQGIADFLTSEQPDLVLLQEVDIRSDRSHRIDQRAALEAAFPQADSLFAYNYNALYVPYPLPPIGHVESGLVTLSNRKVRDAVRMQLPCPFSWPVRLANLKRSLLVSRIPVEGTDRELVVVNLHLEAYDDGEGKAAQTAMLADFLNAEVSKGNYVIAGGDFNQLFSTLDADKWPVCEGLWTPGRIEADAFDARLRMVADDSVPTCRSLDQPYVNADHDRFQYYMIDGFILSDNLTVESAETVSLGFVHSDHNPVRLRLRLGE